MEIKKLIHIIVATGILGLTEVQAWDLDGDVEWFGLSHLGWQDRTPRVPTRGETFKVRFQSHKNDLTSARVRRYLPGDPNPQSFPAQVIHSRGPYLIWEATVPGHNSSQLSYDIEVQDGNDRDYIGVDGIGGSAPEGGPFVLDFTRFSHAPLGSTPVKGGVVFKVWAPASSEIYVRGTFNDWSKNQPMQKWGSTFTRFVPGARPDDSYKYYFEEHDLWKADPFARRIDAGDGNNTIVIDPQAYDWQSSSFTPPPFEEMVCYQLHVGTFSGRNDPFGSAPSPARFIDVTRRIPHLKELGINVVYLNPVIEWPGDFSGGYNPINHTSIEKALGSPDQFKAMVDAFHIEGIAVILDVVYNHVDGGSNYLYNFSGDSAEENIYFDTPVADTPWGPQLDFDRREVREFMLDAVVLLLDEYRLDGLRVDALSAFISGPQSGASQVFLKDMNNLVNQRYRDKIIIAEIFGDDPWYTRPTEFGGLGFDAQYHSNFRDSLRSAIFEAAFGDPNIGALAWATTRSGNEELQGTRCFNYFELHDETWPLNDHQRAIRLIDPSSPHDSEFAKGRSKLAHGMTLLSKGVPCILQGSEWLEDEGWEAAKIDWRHKTIYRGIFDFFRDLIHLRTSNPALFTNAFAHPYHVNENDNVLVFERSQNDANTFVIIANFSNSDWTGGDGYRIGLPRGGEWASVLNSEAKIYDGDFEWSCHTFRADSTSYDGLNHSTSLKLPPRSLIVLENNPSSQRCEEELPSPHFRRGDANNDALVDISDPIAQLSHLFTGKAFLTCFDTGDTNDDGAVDVSDPIHTLTVLFLGTGEIPPPGKNECGEDPSEDELVCESYPACEI